MKLLNAKQLKAWDQFTIEHEPVASIDLMERASKACAAWMLQQFSDQNFAIFCGNGNNGGEGLAIARLLSSYGCNIEVFVLNETAAKRAEFTNNYNRLKEISSVPIVDLRESILPAISENSVIVDALFGTGLNRPLEGFSKTLIDFINQSQHNILAIDMHSGLLNDQSSKGLPVIKAKYTLTFQCLKLALLLPENQACCGSVEVLDIGLDSAFLETIETPFELITKSLKNSLQKPRAPFSHKGSFGHALIVAGSYGKMGAAILATKACLRSGAGLVTAHLPIKGIEVMQISAPEAMCQADTNSEFLTGFSYDLSPYTAVGVGPGIGMNQRTASAVHKLIQTYQKPIVLDADALNILAAHKEWLQQLPHHTILTPHPKEFSRLFGNDNNDYERIQNALDKSKEFNIIIVLKGHRTFIALPNGRGFFNTTGNAGMAKGGSGDILTGCIAGLLAQGYRSEEAAIMGVYLHGLAGDRAAQERGMIAMTAGDIINAFKCLES